MSPETAAIHQIEINIIRHFEQIKDSDVYSCKYCLKTFKEREKDDMLQHLRKKHPVRAQPNCQNNEHQNGQHAVAVKNERAGVNVIQAPDADGQGPMVELIDDNEEDDANDDDGDEITENEDATNTEENQDEAAEESSDSYVVNESDASSTTEENFDKYEEKLLRLNYTYVEQFPSHDQLDTYRKDHGFNISGKGIGTVYRCKHYVPLNCLTVARSLPNFRFYQKGNHKIECPFSQPQLNRSRARSCVPSKSNPKRGTSKCDFGPENSVPRRSRSRDPSCHPTNDKSASTTRRSRSKTPSRIPRSLPQRSRSKTPNALMNTKKHPRNKQQLVVNRKLTFGQLAWLETIRNRYQLKFVKARINDFIFHKRKARLDCFITDEYIKIKTVNDGGGGEHPVKTSEHLKNCTWQTLLIKLDDKCKSLFSK